MGVHLASALFFVGAGGRDTELEDKAEALELAIIELMACSSSLASIRSASPSFSATGNSVSDASTLPKFGRLLGTKVLVVDPARFVLGIAGILFK